MLLVFRRLRAAAALLLAGLVAAPIGLVRADGPPAGRDPDAAGGDRIESPYFRVGGAAGTDALPLKSTRVDVRVLGVIADVRVTQRYRNTGERALEANYVFPGSTRSAVHGLTMRVGDRLLTAKIREREQARREYEGAKRQGRTAALLAQHRDNVFQMSVANILPGDTIDVELRYTELLVPTDGRYAFVFPTVVGPRYVGAGGGAGAGADGGTTGAGRTGVPAETWTGQPYLRAGEPPPGTFEMNVELATPIALAGVNSPSHPLTVRREADATYVTIAPSARPAANRDFVLEYRLAGDRIQSGLMLSRGRDENFFLAMIEPPAATPASVIVPRDYVFVVDVSGSMNGFPLDTARALMNDLLSGLRPSDTFNLLLFAGDNAVLAPRSIPATRANIDVAIDALARQPGGGGTELVPAIRRALQLPNDADRARSIVVVTDGYVSVERETFELIRRNLSNANLFAFGIGSSVNRSLIEGMARAGHGEPFVVLDAGSAPEASQRFRAMIDSPVLTHVSAQFEGVDAYDVSPAQLPDLFARRPIVLYGKWRGAPSGALVVRGRTASGEFVARLPFDARAADPKNGALRLLWARDRIAELNDQEALEGGTERRAQLVALGLRYGLMTSYTSFVAIDRVVRRSPHELLESVDQPIVMPEGVSDLAVGAEAPAGGDASAEAGAGATLVPATPEPGMLGLLAVLGVVLTLAVWRRS